MVIFRIDWVEKVTLYIVLFRYWWAIAERSYFLISSENIHW